MLTCAIGDIHGMADKLRDLLTQIERWRLAHEPSAPFQLVFLGDYIDRGPNSREVLDIVRALEFNGAICLKGNHEALMAASLNSERAKQHFLSNGGDTTLASIGVLGAFLEATEWMDALPLSYEDDHRFFVHAGVRPGIPLGDRAADDLLWIREPFLSHPEPFPKYIVHGHSPTLRLPGRSKRPHVLAQRCNLDTGAVYGGCLSAGVFNQDCARPIALLSSN